jgi:bifunctional ADP-heptose synthase (sugar kinase/adenylyltransferase)
LIETCRVRRKRVVVIGDAMVDVWVHGDSGLCQDGCDRFLEHARCETPGGAANAANCLAHWPVEVSLYGQEGGARPRKVRFVAGDRIAFRHDHERYFNPATATWSYDRALEMVGCAAAVLLSDYDKGFLTEEFVAEVSALCRKLGIPCVADCKRNISLYEGCIQKGNGRYWGSYPLSSAAVATYGPDRPCVGLRSELVGPVLPPVKCANHVGAGDCFAAHLALALAQGFSLKEAAALAHSAGRVYVQHPHSRPPRPEEIAADLASEV